MTRRSFAAAVLAATLGISGLGLGGVATVASAGGPPPKVFTLTGYVVSANPTNHQFVVLSGITRYSIFTTSQTRYTLNQQQATFTALRPGLRVTTTGLFRAAFRVAVRVMLQQVPVTTTTTATQPPSAALSSALTAVLAQERYALVTYQNVVAKLGNLPPFANIIRSEQQHVATVTALMSVHNVSVPSAPGTGAAAPATRTLACQLGVTTETAIITLYQRDIPLVAAYPDVVRAFSNLLDASQYGHLPAYLRCA